METYSLRVINEDNALRKRDRNDAARSADNRHSFAWHGAPQRRAVPRELPELFTPEEWIIRIAEFGLSPRQAQVARLLCLGLSKPQMARRLRLSEGAIRMHVKFLFRKLGINDRIGVPVRLITAGQNKRPTDMKRKE